MQGDDRDYLDARLEALRTELQAGLTALRADMNASKAEVEKNATADARKWADRARSESLGVFGLLAIVFGLLGAFGVPKYVEAVVNADPILQVRERVHQSEVATNGLEKMAGDDLRVIQLDLSRSRTASTLTRDVANLTSQVGGLAATVGKLDKSAVRAGALLQIQNPHGECLDLDLSEHQRVQGVQCSRDARIRDAQQWRVLLW